MNDSLGFLNTGDEAIRGNMGMKDQSMALKWLQQSIQAFGGDPKRLTLLGESAGAVCSHLHQFSPMSRGLFNNVVSQSGSGLHFWSINDQPKVQAQRFASSVGCARNDTQEMKKCLQELDAEQLVDAHREMLVRKIENNGEGN
jgi:bile salt-stimulated lipase